MSQDSNLVTDLTKSLSLQETNLLAKGPTFSLSPGVNKHTARDINIAFCRLGNQIRWKEYRDWNQNWNQMHAEFIIYPQSKHIYKPSSTEELEITLRRVHHNLQTVIRNIKPKQKWSTIDRIDRDTIKKLKEKDLFTYPVTKD